MPPSETITIRLPVELKGKLEALAVSTNRSKSWLAAHAIASYVEEQSWQINAIETAVVMADSSEAAWIDRSEVDEWLSTWGTENEKLNPCA